LKALCFFSALFAAMLMPCAGPAQLATPLGPMGPPPPAYAMPGTPAWPLPTAPIPGFLGPPAVFNDDPRVFSLYAKVGYQWMKFDASFPVPGVNPAKSVRVFDSMDLRLIEVGPPVTRRPPHRSRRAVFPHRAPQDCSPPHGGVHRKRSWLGTCCSVI